MIFFEFSIQMASGISGSFSYISRRWAYIYKYVFNIDLQKGVFEEFN